MRSVTSTATIVGSRRRGRCSIAAGTVAALAILASGCAATPHSNAGTTPPAVGPADASAEHAVVAIGDSIPFNSPDDCPGCTGFVESYAAALTKESGEAHTAVNRSRHDGARTADILNEVESGSLDDVLSDAEVIIVSAGFNDQPPYDEGPCRLGGVDLDTVDGAAEALAATTSECITARTAEVGADLAGALAAVRERAPDTLILALTSYNSWTGWPEFEALGAEKAGAATEAVAEGLREWRAVVCAEAERVGGKCVDLLAAFNGPDGVTPSGGLLAEDYTHPSQEGNEVITELLLAA